MKDKVLTHRWSLTKTGATTDRFTPTGAIIMVASVFLYGIIQVLLMPEPGHIDTLSVRLSHQQPILALLGIGEQVSHEKSSGRTWLSSPSRELCAPQRSEWMDVCALTFSCLHVSPVRLKSFRARDCVHIV